METRTLLWYPADVMSRVGPSAPPLSSVSITQSYVDTANFPVTSKGMSYCSQTLDSSLFKICWGWRIQFQKSISSSVYECGVCVCVFASAFAHKGPLCTFSHGLSSSISHSPSYSCSYARWTSAPAIPLSLSALLGTGVPGTCMATVAFHLGDEIHRCPMPVQRVLLPSEPSLWLPPIYSWNPSKKHFYAVSRVGKKGTCSLLAGCWSRLTQVKWIILSQL